MIATRAIRAAFSFPAKRTLHSDPRMEKAQMPYMQTTLLSEDEAADELSILKTTLAGLRRAGRGPRHIRVNHYNILYRPQDLDAWVEQMAMGGDR
jgi:hypothetical protein